jgi:hypothetical protein
MARLLSGLRGLSLLFAVFVAACGDKVAGPGDTSACDNGLTFAVFPVPLSAIASITPVGAMGPPIHTIPTDHGGVYLNSTAVPIVSPAAARIKTINRARYLVSPFRQGQTDYFFDAVLCGSYSLRFSHLITVVDRIASRINGSNCSTYSTANETVETCSNNDPNIELAAGESIGTVGSASSGAFDFGLYDANTSNFFVNPGRFSGPTRTAICPYEPYPVAMRNQLYALLETAGIHASGEEPQCGSMSVDVAGTAQGVWVLRSNPVNQTGDETSFLVLAPHPMYPVSKQAVSAGPTTIAPSMGSPSLARYPIQTTGRVNRRFRDISADGLIYCYVYEPSPNFSYFVRLAVDGVLTIQRVLHPPGATPCNNDPSTWTLSGAALAFIR